MAEAIWIAVSGIATAVACGIVTQFIEFQKFKVVVILWLGFAALCDVLIAISLVTLLVRPPLSFINRGKQG
jgi:hypothetical protein